MSAYSEDDMIDIGGHLWQARSGMRRIYLNDWHELAGFDVDYYKTGNVYSATLGGETISNNKASRLVDVKVYWQNGLLCADYTKDSDPHLWAERDMWGRIHNGIKQRLTPEPTYSAREVANYYRVSVSTVYRWIAEGKISATKNERGRWEITTS